MLKTSWSASITSSSIAIQCLKRNHKPNLFMEPDSSIALESQTMHCWRLLKAFRTTGMSSWQDGMLQTRLLVQDPFTEFITQVETPRRFLSSLENWIWSDSQTWAEASITGESRNGTEVSLSPEVQARQSSIPMEASLDTCSVENPLALDQTVPITTVLWVEIGSSLEIQSLDISTPITLTSFKSEVRL